MKSKTGGGGGAVKLTKCFLIKRQKSELLAAEDF